MDTSIRDLALLSAVPRPPFRIGTAELVEVLKDKGFSVTVRSVQRDLVKLSHHHALVCDDSARPHAWFWDKNAPPLGAGALDPAMAIALVLAGEGRPLPPSLRQALRPLVTQAHKVFAPPPKGARGRQPPRVLVRPADDAGPDASFEVAGAVTRALAARRRVRVRALAPDGQVRVYVLSPLGLVDDGTGLRLVARALTEEAPRVFALAAIKSAKVLDEAADAEAVELAGYLGEGPSD